MSAHYRTAYPDLADRVLTVMNGVDAGTAATRYRRDPAALRLAYTGILYGDRRDAKPLLRAAQGLGVPVSIDFYGSEPEIVGRLAAEFPGPAIADRGHVSRDAETSSQAPAEAMLPLVWGRKGRRVGERVS